MIKEVIVVEGRQDVLAVRRAVEADCLTTGGFTLNSKIIENIRQAYIKRGIIILTDPDGAGERIRRFLSERFPNAKHAFVPKQDALANDDVGIEQASPEAIRSALDKVRYLEWEPVETFTGSDLLRAGLSGSREASLRRAKIGARLGVGYANAKTLLTRLNHYGVTRQEFEQAIHELEVEEQEKNT